MPRSTKSKRAQASKPEPDVMPGVGKDLRLVYLLAFDNFATDPVEVNGQYSHISTRYARELLATLSNALLLTVTEDNLGGNQMWQVNDPGTYDNHSRDEAEAVVDAWLAENAPDAAPAPSASGTARRASPAPRHPATHPCLCGCQLLVGRKSNYRPGHDARHAGDVARSLAVTKDKRRYAKMVAALPTDALKDKAIAMAQRLTDKAASK